MQTLHFLDKSKLNNNTCTSVHNRVVVEAGTSETKTETWVAETKTETWVAETKTETEAI